MTSIKMCERCGIRPKSSTGRVHLCDHCRDRCADCGEVRESTYKTWCRLCTNRRARETRASRSKHYRAKSNQWKSENRDRYLSNKRRWHSDNPDSVRRTRLRKWNMTPEMYDEMLESQSGVCKICHTESPGGRGNTYFYVDHDHNCCDGDFSCGRCIRGLLCNNCNRTIGMIDDNVDILLAMADYLSKWIANKLEGVA